MIIWGSNYIIFFIKHMGVCIMHKRIIGILVTAGILVGCLALPSLAVGSYSYRVYRAGKYIDSQFSQCGVVDVSATSYSVRTSSYIEVNYGKWKKTDNSSFEKHGSYSISTDYVYAKDIKSVYGWCEET